MTPLIATLSCHNGSFGYFCQWFTVSVCHWYFSCLLVMFSPLPRWCFAAFLGWIITFWDDVSCHLGHSHHTPSPLPLRLPLDTSLLPSCLLATLTERKERLRDLGSGARKTTNAPSTAVGVQWFTPTGHALPDGPVGMPEWSVTVGAKSLPGPSSDMLLYSAQQSVQKKRTVCACVNKDYPFWVWGGLPHSFSNRKWTFFVI